MPRLLLWQTVAFLAAMSSGCPAPETSDDDDLTIQTDDDDSGVVDDDDATSADDDDASPLDDDDDGCPSIEGSVNVSPAVGDIPSSAMLQIWVLEPSSVDSAMLPINPPVFSTLTSAAGFPAAYTVCAEVGTFRVFAIADADLDGQLCEPGDAIGASANVVIVESQGPGVADIELDRVVPQPGCDL